MSPRLTPPTASRRWLARLGTRRALLLLALVLVLAVAALLAWRALAPAAQARPGYWPTTAWRTSPPEAQGLASDKLAALVSAIRAQDIPVHSLMVVRNGYVVLDAYFYPYDGQAPHNVASVTKSVMTTLIGIAADQGRLGLDDKLLSFFPGRAVANRDARKDAITVRHLASMSSGLDCTAESDELTLQQMVASPDWVQFALDRKVTWEPGEHFVYCTPAIHLLSPILQQATGMPALDFARQYLFAPLGIDEALWTQDPQGYYAGGEELSLRPHDMARLGYLMLNHGQWEGRQIVSRQWLDQATRAQMSTADDPYGYGWWIDPAVKDGYRAARRGGQYIYILPEWDMNLVATGGGFAMDEIAELLVASFSDFEAPLPANPEAVARLQAAVAAAAQPPTPRPVAPLPDLARAISGQTYVFDANPASLQSIAVAFDGSSEAVISFRGNGRPLASAPVGLDGVYRFSPGPDGRPRAYRGAWLDAQTFFLEYDGITNNDHSLFQFRYEGDQVTVKVQETAHDIGAQFVGRLQQP